MDLQQWPKSLPSKGTLELDVLQLPLSKVPWIARDGSICINTGGKQMAPKAAGLMTDSVTPAAETPRVADDGNNEDNQDNGDEPKSGVSASHTADSGKQAEADTNDEGMSENGDGGMNDTMMGAASSAVHSAPV